MEYIRVSRRAARRLLRSAFVSLFIFFFTWPQKGLIVVVYFHVFKPASDHQNEQQSFPFLFSCASSLRTHFHVSPSFLKTSLRPPSEGLRRSKPSSLCVYFLIASTRTISLRLFGFTYLCSLGLTSALLHLMDKNPAHLLSSIDRSAERFDTTTCDDGDVDHVDEEG